MGSRLEVGQMKIENNASSGGTYIATMKTDVLLLKLETVEQLTRPHLKPIELTFSNLGSC